MNQKKYDLEQLLADIETILKANVNTKLLAIATEKGDSIVCPPIDGTYGYACQSLNEKVMNQDAYIFYGVDGIETTGIEGASSNKYSLSILVILADDGNDPNILKKVLRYQRALRESIEENSGKLPQGQMTVSSGTPQKVKDVNSANDAHVIGIFVEIAIA